MRLKRADEKGDEKKSARLRIFSLGQEMVRKMRTLDERFLYASIRSRMNKELGFYLSSHCTSSNACTRKSMVARTLAGKCVRLG